MVGMGLASNLLDLDASLGSYHCISHQIDSAFKLSRSFPVLAALSPLDHEQHQKRVY